MEAKPFVVKSYITLSGRRPFREWLDRLDKSVRAKIENRIWLFERGTLGDFKVVGRGIYEARIGYGPGYRIYFGKEDQQVILLLLGGDKGTQKHDIIRAHRYWLDYLERK